MKIFSGLKLVSTYRSRERKTALMLSIMHCSALLYSTANGDASIVVVVVVVVVWCWTTFVPLSIFILTLSVCLSIYLYGFI